jgi:hypothetical protein
MMAGVELDGHMTTHFVHDGCAEVYLAPKAMIYIALSQGNPGVV